MTHRHVDRRTILQTGVRAVLLAAAVGGAGSFAAALEIDPTAVRGRLVLPAEPAGAVTPTAAKEALAKEPRPVVVAGRVGARGMDPFLADKASFMLVEIPADDHAKKPGHDNDNCPFCKKRQANAPMVAVRFVGTDGKELPIDSRKVVGIQKGSDVVIRGSGVFDAKLGIPVIQLTADGIFVRPVAK
ncbi:MAG: hypothetical protein ACKOTB_13560 [Planctomycetia bacterium]